MNIKLAQIKAQKYFYRDRYDRVVKLLLLFLSLMMLLGSILVILFLKQPNPAHYATSLGGNLTRLSILKEPHHV